MSRARPAPLFHPLLNWVRFQVPLIENKARFLCYAFGKRHELPSVMTPVVRSAVTGSVRVRKSESKMDAVKILFLPKGLFWALITILTSVLTFFVLGYNFYVQRLLVCRHLCKRSGGCYNISADT